MVGWVALAAGMERVRNARRAGRAEEAVTRLRDLLGTVWTADQQVVPQGPERLRHERLAALADEMAANPTTRWSVPALAHRLDLGREHFTRAFTRVLGLPPGQFLIQVRLDRAKALLRGTPATIAEVAQRLGYDTPASFTRQFTAVVGCSPRAYRQSLGGWDMGNVVG